MLVQLMVLCLKYHYFYGSVASPMKHGLSLLTLFFFFPAHISQFIYFFYFYFILFFNFTISILWNKNSVLASTI